MNNSGKKPQQTKKGMTVMKKTLLLAVAVAGAFTLATRAQADDALLSPKAKELRDSVRTVSGTTPDLLDRSVRAGSPKAIAFAESLRKVPGTTEDKLVRNTGTTSPRLLANEPQRLQQFQVAPLK